jgi:hypothetical protein
LSQDLESSTLSTATIDYNILKARKKRYIRWHNKAQSRAMINPYSVRWLWREADGSTRIFHFRKPKPQIEQPQIEQNWFPKEKPLVIIPCVECGLIGWHDIPDCKRLSKMRAVVDRRY